MVSSTQGAGHAQVQDPNCIFCKIVQGRIPSARVLETAEAIVFLDINPVNHGHVLIVPRAHHAQLFDLPADLAAHAGSLLPRVCRAVRAATNAEGINVVINNGRVAGQTVEHCHWHVIPRFTGDPLKWPWPQGAYPGDSMDEMKRRIEGALQLSGPVSSSNDHGQAPKNAPLA